MTMPASGPGRDAPLSALASALSQVSLVVFARAPTPGQVKTRLTVGAPASASPQRGAPGDADLNVLTHQQAAGLYGAFLRDICDSGARSGLGRLCLYVAEPRPEKVSETARGPGGRAGDVPVDPLLAEVASQHGFALRTQHGADLGARMDRAIHDELAQGAAAVVLIGSDSPTVPTAYLRDAAGALLQGTDVVLGPALDGGYWLVGARRPFPPLFAPGIEWSSDRVLCQTLERLSQGLRQGLSVRLLPFFYDVDTPADLRLLISLLRLSPDDGTARHTRRALTELGLL